MKIFIMVKDYLFNRKKRLALFLFISITTWILTLLLPSFTGKYMDTLINKQGTQSISTFTELLVLLLTIDIVFTYIKSLLFTWLSNKTAFELNYHVLEHVKKLPLTYFSGINTAYLTQRISSDTNLVTGFVLENMVGVLGNVLMFIAALVYMFTVNPAVSCFLLLTIPLYALVYVVFRKVLFQKEFETREKLNTFFGIMNEQLYKIKLIKINAWFNLFGEGLKAAFGPLFKSQLEMAKTAGRYSAATKAVSHLAKILMFFFGGIQVYHSNMTIGEFTAINAYFAMLLDCTTYFLGLGRSYQQALVSYTRLREILGMRIEMQSDKLVDAIRHISLKNVSFGYDANRQLLKEFNYNFEQGKIYCIFGKNGIGKSTLIDLLIGLHQNYEGEININGVNIKELDLYALRKNHIGFVEQEPALFSHTVLKNLTLGLDEYTKEDLESILSQLEMESFFNSLHDGLNTLVSEKANNISGGEKQKLSIARALLKNPDVLIFDEPTSAMDQAGVASLKRLMKSLKQNKIILIVTHNNHMQEIADEVLCFDRPNQKPSIQKKQLLEA